MTGTLIETQGIGVSLSQEDEERATRVHAEAIVIDGCQSPTFDSQFFDDLRVGGITAINATAAAADSATLVNGHNDRTAREGVLALQRIRNWVADNPESAVLATSVETIRRAKAEGKGAIVMAFQHDGFIEDTLDLFSVFHSLGLRVFQMTYNRRGPLGDGCLEPANGGLSRMGREAVGVLNELGILIDLAHCGDRTILETIELSEKPVVFTHANPRAISDTPRGKSDDALKAMADSGGVIGITFWCPITATKKDTRPTVADVLDHIDYAVGLVGIDHVAFGSDWNLKNTRDRAERMRQAEIFLDKYPEMRKYGNVGRDPLGLDYSPEAPNLTRGLVSRGYSDEDIRKLLGGNWLRVMEEAWVGQ
jgi:membrane dipeptidase